MMSWMLYYIKMMNQEVDLTTPRSRVDNPKAPMIGWEIN